MERSLRRRPERSPATMKQRLRREALRASRLNRRGGTLRPPTDPLNRRRGIPRLPPRSQVGKPERAGNPSAGGRELAAGLFRAMTAVGGLRALHTAEGPGGRRFPARRLRRGAQGAARRSPCFIVARATFGRPPHIRKEAW